MENDKNKELLEFFKDTSKILSDFAVTINSNIIANNYTENVEFWKWIEKNFHNMDLSSSSAIANEVLSKEGFKTQIYGKIYEWDWTNKERWKFSNIDNAFVLPDDPSYEGVDVIKKSLWGGTDEYQLKSYTNGHPDLSNTPKDATVVTNSENVSYAENRGYDSKKFMDKEDIAKRRAEIIEEVESGDATPRYKFSNIAGAMLGAGAFGFVVSAGVEALNSYEKYKLGFMSKEDYIKEILKSGSERGLTASATTGVMIPVSAMLTAMGASALLTVPIAFIVNDAIAAPVSAAFGHGEYSRILSEAKIFKNTAEMAKDFSNTLLNSHKEFVDFIESSKESDRIFLKNSEEFNREIAKLTEKFGGDLYE